MSLGERMPWTEAAALARDLKALIGPYTERMTFAGSLRRKAATVGDIEMVVIPKVERITSPQLFGGEQTTARTPLLEALDEWMRVGTIGRHPSPSWGERLRRFVYRDRSVDLCIVPEPGRYGMVLLLRTGPQEFSHGIAAWLHGRRDYRLAGGALERDGGITAAGEPDWRPVPTPEEADVFAAIGLPYLAPEERTADALQRSIAEWRATHRAARG